MAIRKKSLLALLVFRQLETSSPDLQKVFKIFSSGSRILRSQFFAGLLITVIIATLGPIGPYWLYSSSGPPSLPPRFVLLFLDNIRPKRKRGKEEKRYRGKEEKRKRGKEEKGKRGKEEKRKRRIEQECGPAQPSLFYIIMDS